MDPPAQLDYAPPPRWRALRFARRGGLVLVIIAATILAVVYSWKFALRLRRAQLQQQCLEYTAPREQLIYTEDASEAGRLLGSGAHYLDTRTGAAFLPPPAARFFAGERPAGYAFLHGRRLSGQDERLVSVRVWIWHTSSSTRTVWLESLVQPKIELAVPRGGPGLLPAARSLALPLREDDTLRLYAGQPDPADLSHFTITYDLNGQRGTIDGWLKPDDTVTLDVRDGPLRTR